MITNGYGRAHDGLALHLALTRRECGDGSGIKTGMQRISEIERADSGATDADDIEQGVVFADGALRIDGLTVALVADIVGLSVIVRVRIDIELCGGCRSVRGRVAVRNGLIGPSRLFSANYHFVSIIAPGNGIAVHLRAGWSTCCQLLPRTDDSRRHKVAVIRQVVRRFCNSHFRHGITLLVFRVHVAVTRTFEASTA